MAATLYPNRVLDLAHHLEGTSEEQSGLFWHGVGRGLYFLPDAFIPWRSKAQARASTLAERWPVSDTGRVNALAGIARAMTLVNIRDPQVVRRRLREQASDSTRHGTFRNGMTSALIVWLSTNPEDSFVDALDRFQPSAGEPVSVELWDGIVRRACRDARRFAGEPVRDNLAAKVFRLRPLPA